MKIKKHSTVKKWVTLVVGVIVFMVIYLVPLQSRHSDVRDNSTKTTMASNIRKDVKNISSKGIFNDREMDVELIEEDLEDAYTEAADFVGSAKVTGGLTPPYGVKLRTVKGNYIQTEEQCRKYCTRECGQGITEEVTHFSCIPGCYLQYCPQFKYTR